MFSKRMSEPSDPLSPPRGADSPPTETGPESVERTLNVSHETVVSNRAVAAPSGRSDGLETERYSELEVIGSGGSGVVIRARDKDILRDVAIKVVDPTLASDGSVVGRFAEEARIMGQLEHPSIVPVYELGVDQRGRRFLCMKLIEGATLEATLSALGDVRLTPLHLAHLLQVFVKVCDAVSFAHSRGVLHRDLKPTNVMVSDFGQVYVLDWGIARLRRGSPQVGHRVRVTVDREEEAELDPPGSFVGTASYMAPEQILGRHEELDERTDVFSLGATLYQILTGRPPLTAEIVRAVWMRKEPDPIARPEALVTSALLPLELSRIAMRALAYSPAERYASVGALKEDIEAFQRGVWDLPRVTFPAGSVILREGEPGDCAYVIVEGRCAAYKVKKSGTEVELRVMGPGEVFGETAVFSNKPRTASVKSVTDVVLLIVTGQVLSKAVGLNSWMGAFVKTLADRFREAEERKST
jgi:serine/threonine-protein kinase